MRSYEFAYFGRDLHGLKDTIATWCSPRMAAYLRANGPWSQLVRLNNLTLHEIELGKPFPLEEGVTVTALPVPHRDALGKAGGTRRVHDVREVIDGRRDLQI